MKILQRINKFFTAGSSSCNTPPGIWQNVSNFMGFQDATTKQKQLAEYRGWVYSCVTSSASQVGNVKLNLMRRKSNGEAERVVSHRMLDLLEHVNSTTTKFELFEATETFLELCGDAYWWIPEGKTEIHMLPPATTAFKKTDRNSPDIESWIVMLEDGKKLTIPPEEVIHFKTPNPSADPRMPFYGLGTVQAAMASIDNENESNWWNKKFFKNSARPDLILKQEELVTDDQQKRLEAAWSKDFGGGKTHSVVVLRGGLDVVQAGFSQKDMDFVKLKGITFEEILGMFKTPKAMLGMVADANRSNVQAAREIYALNKIDPDVRRIINHLNEFYIPLFGDDDLFFDFQSTLPENREQTLEFYKIGTDAAFLTVNEIRTKEGLPPLEGGDKPFNNPKSQLEKGATIKQVVDYIPCEKEPNTTTVEKISKSLDKYFSSIETKQSESYGDKYHVDTMKVFEEMTENETARFQKMTIALFRDQEKRVMAGLKKERKDIKQAEDLVFDLEEEAKLFSETSQPLYIKIINEGADQAAIIARSDHDYEISKRTEEEIKTRADKFFGLEVNKTTLASLTKTLTAGIGEGETIDQLIKRINSVYSIAKNSRAETIARTESLNAINAAQRDFYDQDPQVKSVQWLASLDNRVRDGHKALHGKIVDKKKIGRFTLAGIKIQGPQDPALPASEFINCRCKLAPIVNDNIE